MPIREPLESLAFGRSEATDGHALREHRCVSSACVAVRVDGVEHFRRCAYLSELVLCERHRMNHHTDAATVRVERAGLVAVHAHVRLPCVEGDRQDVPRLRVAVYSLAVSVLQAARDFNASSSRVSSSQTYEPSITLKVRAESTTTFSACSKSGGRLLPRLSARRRIPTHAFGLK